MSEARSVPRPGPRWRSARTYSRIALLTAVVAVSVASVVLSTRLDIARHAGYPAVALLSFFSSASLFFPAPGLAVVCVAGYTLEPLPVALLATTGMTFGELTGYFTGFSGRGLVEKQPLYLKMEGWTRRWGWAVFFVFAVIPNPVFDLAGMAAGALRYPLWRFLPVVWLGKLLKALAVTYGCAYGVQGVLRWFNLD